MGINSFDAGSRRHRLDISPVETPADFEAALDQRCFDLILSDHTLPSFDGLYPRGIARQKHPELPFIFVSGTIGEELAVDSLKQGATDYVLKDRLSRLVTSVQRAIREAQERAERRQAELKVREQAALLDQATDAIFARDLEQAHHLLEQRRRTHLWMDRKTGVGQTGGGAALPGRLVATSGNMESGAGKRRVVGELRQVTKTGKEIIVESRRTLLRDADGKPAAILNINREHHREEADRGAVAARPADGKHRVARRRHRP